MAWWICRWCVNNKGQVGLYYLHIIDRSIRPAHHEPRAVPANQIWQSKALRQNEVAWKTTFYKYLCTTSIWQFLKQSRLNLPIREYHQHVSAVENGLSILNALWHIYVSMHRHSDNSFSLQPWSQRKKPDFCFQLARAVNSLTSVEKHLRGAGENSFLRSNTQCVIN